MHVLSKSKLKLVLDLLRLLKHLVHFGFYSNLDSSTGLVSLTEQHFKEIKILIDSLFLILDSSLDTQDTKAPLLNTERSEHAAEKKRLVVSLQVYALELMDTFFRSRRNERIRCVEDADASSLLSHSFVQQLLSLSSPYR